jgi:hypothetical protein
MKRISRTFRNGFSLGEVLLSIAVLVIGMLPVFSSLSKGYQISVEDRRIIMASGLAQEGVELIQNIRNNSVLSSGSSSLSEFLPANVESGATLWENCRIDADDSVLDDPTLRMTGCGSGAYDLASDASGILVHDMGDGLFKRRVFMSYDPSAEMLDVVSAVYWDAFEPTDIGNARTDCLSANGCVYAETRLSAWR